MDTAAFVLDSTLAAVDEAEESVRRFAQAAGFEEHDQYFIRLAAREILINAIKHGNGFDPVKKVGLRMAVTGEALTLEVTDEGAGFLLEDVPNPHLPENRERRSGRGITMARAIMDELSVERNSHGGAQVRMVKRKATSIGGSNP